MSLKDKLLNTKDITRRTFLKGASAAGASAALYGCGGSSDPTPYVEEDTSVEIPKIEERIIPGASPHNCGGRCLSKYHVKDGVIKRITTDNKGDKPLNNGDDPEYRACVRCRSKKQWFTRNDRLMYPLKQTGERGDINGFQRISWEQAVTEIADKMKEIQQAYGNEAFHFMYASGDATGVTSYVGRMLGLFGGYTSYYLSYSSPALQHVARFVDGVGFFTPFSNSKQDSKDSDNIVLWSNNSHETIATTNTGWYLTQLKELGIPITSVDVRYSKSASTVASDFIDIEAGTDTAFVLAMMHHLLTARLADLDVDFINKYCYGFFDNGNSAYHADLDTTAAGYAVPDGASLSAFVMGNDNSLVTAGLNNATSVYPNTIGYNVNPDDDLYGKTVSIYGQLPKTPEWAEAITGIPAARIRAFADMFLDTKVSTWTGLGYNRGAEAEQVIWILRILHTITKNFGINGADYGYKSENINPPVPSNNLGGVPNNVNLRSKIYDDTRLTAPLAYVPTGQQSQISVFVIPDAIENAGKGKSKWNDGQIKQLTTPFKAVFNAGGNIPGNQHSGTGYITEIFQDRANLDLFVNMEPFMTASALLADYILPTAVPGEKPASASSGGAAIKMNKIVDSPGEALDEYTISGMISEKLGFGSEYYAGYEPGTDGLEAIMKDRWEAADLSSTYGMTYDEWSEAGIASLHGTSTGQVVMHKAYRDDPAAHPLETATGKFEAYCLNMTEDYEARYHENIDTVTTDSDGTATLYNGGYIYTKYHGASTARRFVYPIPMYIPESEGLHAVDFTDPSSPYVHDDPLGLKAKGYKYHLLSWHMMYRSHSTGNNIAHLHEVYKKNAFGNKAFLKNDREYTEGVWEDGIYEPCWVNSTDANSIGIQTGDRVIISNDRGKIYASAVITARIPIGTLAMGQGAWRHVVNGIDVGGCVGTVTSPRPSRICKGNNCATDCRIKIEKA